MRASRSVGRRVAQGLRTLANKAGKGDTQGVKAGQAGSKAGNASPAGTPAATGAGAKPAAPAAAAAAAALPKAPAAPAGAAAGAAAAGAEGGKWIIHPAVPVDARLVAAGLVGAGLVAYNTLSSSGSDTQESPAAAEVVVEEEMVAEAPSEQQAELADVAPQHVDEGFHMPQQAAEQREAAAAEQQEGRAAGSAGEDGEPVTVMAVGEEQQGAEELAPTFVDGAKVLSLIEEVLTRDASHLLQQAGALAKSQEAPAAPEAAARAEMPPEPAPQVKGGSGGRQRARARAAAKEGSGDAAELAEALAAVLSGLEDSAGELLASEVAKAAPTLAAAGAPEPAAPGPLPTLQELGPEVAHASSILAGVGPMVKEVLGVEQDVTPSGLIQQATQHGQGAGEDWLQYRHRHRQAVADAQFIAALLEAAAKNVKGKLEAKDAAIADGEQRLEAARRGLQAQGEEFRKLLQQALDDADKQAKTALRLQAQQLAVAHAEVTVRERAERAQKVDEVRLKLNALEQALQQRAAEQRVSHDAHQVAVGAFALQSALENGQPLMGPVDYLAKACKDDALVAAAVASIPSDAAERGVWTRAQISDSFRDVQRVSRQLSMVPEGQGGILTIALAKVAAALKCPERGPLVAQLPGGGIDTSLAVIQLDLVNGKLLKAAEDLEAAVRGTAAAREVAGWVQQVRLRVRAEQAAALLQAHASALTASLA